MKCNARLVLSKKTGKIVFSIPSNWSVEGYLSTLTPKRKSKLDLDNIQVCCGKIIAQIGCHEEGDYIDNSYAEMDIDFYCENCKMNYFPELPQSLVSLNDWITKKIEEM